MLKQEYNVGIAKNGFTSNVKTQQKNKFQKNTQQSNSTYACKTNIKSLKVLCSFSISRRQKKKNKKEKYENAKGKQTEMERIYNELKVKYQQETKNSEQLQKEIDRANQVKQTSEEVIKSLKNLTPIRLETVPDK